MLTLLTVGLLAHSLVVPTPRMHRVRALMDVGWQFHLGDLRGAQNLKFNDKAWRTLDLPHDWSIEGTPTENAPGGGRIGFFPTGIGWYRKSFSYDKKPNEIVTIAFDGIHMNSEVWINGVSLGQRPYGYIGFEYDLTAHLIKGVNVIAVRVDNSAQPNSRWYTGSGIYRHVWLWSTGAVRVQRHGVTIAAEVATRESTVVVVRTILENRGNVAAAGVLDTRLSDFRGETLTQLHGNYVLEDRAQYSIKPGESVTVVQRFTAALQLWALDNPMTYLVYSGITAERRDVQEAVYTPFGVRTIAFDKDRGFLLNGQQIKLRGVNLHHEAGALGAAVPEEMWASRLRALKAMGVNAIRTSHNPPAPEFLDLCDRLGFLVMAEAFDEWTAGKVPEGYHRYFEEWSERDLAEFIRRDRNHPSIVLWSAGNEIGEQGQPDGAAVLKRLMGIIRAHDTTRPITTGNDNIAADGSPARPEFLNALDIVGYNYVDRWHERRELMAEQDRHDHPEWRMIGTESGSIFQSFDEQYSLGNDPARVDANYTSGMFQVERLWKWITTRDYFSGNFMWTGFDYLGESTWPFKGFPSGALDITGEPKDAFYLYQSLWGAPPVAHLFPHWNWAGREGQVIPVLAYTSCNVMELYLNGRSVGEQRKEFPAQGTAGGWNTYALPVIRPTTADLHFRWDVPYAPGILRAVGKHRDGSPCATTEVRTAGPAVSLHVTAERDTVTIGRGDVALVRVALVDSAGTVIPDANALFCVQAQGGKVLALDNGNLQDLDPYRPDCRKLFNGRGLIVARATMPGSLRLSVTSPGAREGVVTVTVTEGRAVVAIPAAGAR